MNCHRIDEYLLHTPSHLLSKIDIPWLYVLPAYVIATFAVWAFFGVIWYLIAYSHNDLIFDAVTGAPLHDGQMTCIRGVENATGFFLYSFEIQVNIKPKKLQYVSFNLQFSFNFTDNCWLWRTLPK